MCTLSINRKKRKIKKMIVNTFLYTEELYIHKVLALLTKSKFQNVSEQ